MERIAILILVVALSAGLAGAGEEVVDVGALLEAVPDERALLLGTLELRSGGRWRGWLDDERDLVSPSVSDVAHFLDLAGSTCLELGGRLLVIDPTTGNRARSDLASFSRDLLRAVRIEVLVTHPDGSQTRGEILARPGKWGRVVATETRRFVYDMDVELACDNSGGFNPCVVGDPIVGAALTGFVAEARPFLVDRGRRVALEALVMAGDIDSVDTYRMEARYLGSIELPTYSGATLAVSGTVAAGEPLASRFTTEAGETTVRLVPHVVGPPGKGRIRVLDAGLALLEPRLASFPVYAEGPLDLVQEEAEAATNLQRSGRARAFFEELTDGLDVPGGGLFEIGSGLVVVGHASAQGRVAREVATSVAPLARSVRIDLTVSAGGEPGGKATLHAIHDRAALLRLGTDRSIVFDHDVEVGCYVQIADPIVIPVFSGLIVRAVPRVTPAGVLLELEVRVQARRGPTVRPLGTVECGSLQTVAVSRQGFAGEIPLVAGEPVRIDLGRDASGRSLVMDVTATPD